MIRRTWLIAALMVFPLLVVSLTAADPAQKTRNPFDVKDVPDPDGDDVKAFADTVKLSGGADDDNAKPWTEEKVKGTPKSLDGDWASRWNGGSAAKKWVEGTAQVKSVGGRVYILYKDETGSYLIDTRRVEKDRLVGRYMNLDSPDDSSPWVGRIINPERIDGEWTDGRWDLRRKLADK